MIYFHLHANRFLHWPTASSYTDILWYASPCSMRHCFKSLASRYFCCSNLKAKKISKSEGTRKGSPTILVFPHQTGWHYSDRDKVVWKNHDFRPISRFIVLPELLQDRAIVRPTMEGEQETAPKISRSRYYSTSNNSKKIQDRVAIFTMANQ